MLWVVLFVGQVGPIIAPILFVHIARFMFSKGATFKVSNLSGFTAYIFCECMPHFGTFCFLRESPHLSLPTKRTGWAEFRPREFQGGHDSGQAQQKMLAMEEVSEPELPKFLRSGTPNIRGLVARAIRNAIRANRFGRIIRN